MNVFGPNRGRLPIEPKPVVPGDPSLVSPPNPADPTTSATCPTGWKDYSSQSRHTEAPPQKSLAPKTPASASDRSSALERISAEAQISVYGKSGGLMFSGNLAEVATQLANLRPNARAVIGSICGEDGNTIVRFAPKDGRGFVSRKHISPLIDGLCDTLHERDSASSIETALHEVVTPQAGPQPILTFVERLRSLGITLDPHNSPILEAAQKANIRLEWADFSHKTNPSPAQFDASRNAVQIDPSKFASLTDAAAAREISVLALFEEVLAHEITHGLIASKRPNFDYAAKRRIPRPDFDEPLLQLLARIPDDDGRGGRVLRVVRNTVDVNRAEEVVTYGVTDPDFRALLAKHGQLAPLKAHLERHGLSEVADILR